jgi:D-alanyl-D-alanine dipeptidase
LFYPDRLGYWSEVRRWITVLVRSAWPDAHTQEVLSAAAVLHGQEPAAALASIAVARPRVVVALDDGAVDLLPATSPTARESVTIRDPHRPRQAYAGWWAVTEDGTVVGKAPQHPAAHNFYRHSDLDSFLAAAPLT